MVFVASYVADGPTVHVQTCAGWIDAAEERLHECLNQDTQSKSSRSIQAHDTGWFRRDCVEERSDIVDVRRP